MDTKILEKLIKNHVGGFYSQCSVEFKKQFLTEVWKDCTNLMSELEQLQNKDEEAFVNRLHEVIIDLFGKPKSADRETSFSYRYLQQKNQVVAEYLQRIAFEEDIIKAHRGIGESVFQDVYQEAFDQFEKWKGITRIINDDEWRRKTRDEIMQKHLEHAKDRELYFSGENREELIRKFAYRDYLYHVKQSSVRANEFTRGVTKSMVFSFQIEYLNSLLKPEGLEKDGQLNSWADILMHPETYEKKIKELLPESNHGHYTKHSVAMADALIGKGILKAGVTEDNAARVIGKLYFGKDLPDQLGNKVKGGTYPKTRDEGRFLK